MTDTKLNVTYLSEADVVQAGALDVNRCMAAMRTAFELLSLGDYRMGGANHNSHGLKVDFPVQPEFPTMPRHSPDRRFVAMPAYLGGKYRMTGVKWYGSNVDNARIGLPRSIHLIVLNDTDTGSPVAIMSGNLISAYRTGCIMGLGASYFARERSSRLALIGAGVINRVAVQSILAARPTISEIQIVAKSRQSPRARLLREFIEKEFPAVTTSVAGTIDEAIDGADIVSVAATGLHGTKNYPYLHETHISPGAYIVSVSNVRFDETFLGSTSHNIIDHTALYEAYAEDLEPPFHERVGLLGLQFQDMYAAGSLKKEQVTEFGSVVRGLAPGRTSESETFVFGVGGMAVEDVAWATELYETATREGIGTQLPIWEAPILF